MTSSHQVMAHVQREEALPQILVRRARTYPDRRALVVVREGQPPQHITNSKLHEDALRAAGALRRRGVGPRDVVLLALDHGYPLARAFWGCLFLGAVPCVCPYLAPGATPESFARRVARLARHSSPRLIVTRPRYLPLLRELGEGPRGTGYDLVSEVALTTDDVGDWLAAEFDPGSTADAPAFLQYSSGTTGSPKGVLLSHAVVQRSLSAMGKALQMGERDVSVTWAPFYHEMGLLLGFLLPLAAGGEAVLLSPFEWVRRPAALFEAIDRYRGTVSWMPNFGFDLCVRRIDDAALQGINLSSLRFIGNGSEPVRERTMDRFYARFSTLGVRREMLLTGYGLAENVVLATTTRPGEIPTVDRVRADRLQNEREAIPAPDGSEGAVSVVSCGRALPDSEVVVLDEERRRLPDRVVGEVALRGAYVFEGYFRDPTRTAETLRDGWLMTGDLGYTVEGELYLCARKKDMLIVGGQNIYPESVEDIAQQVLGSGGARVAAFGLEDETLGTEVLAVVCELRVDLDGAARHDLRAKIRQRIVDDLAVSPADVRFVPKGWICKTTSGKLARGATRQRYIEAGYRPLHAVPGARENGTPRDDTVEERLIQCFEDVFGTRPTSLDQPFWQDTGDSLAILQLFLLIEERFDQKLSMEQVLRFPAIGQIAELLKGAERSVGENESTEGRNLISPRPHPARTSDRRSAVEERRRRARRVAGHLSRRLGALPYPVALRLWRTLAGLPLLHAAMPEERSLLRACIEEGGYGSDARDVVRQSFLVNLWRPWWTHHFSDRTTRGRWVVIRNGTAADRARASGKGVILAGHHSVLLAVSRAALRDRFGAPYALIGAHRSWLADHNLGRLARCHTLYQLATSPAVLSGELYTAQSTLRSNGTLFLMADGRQGEQQVEIPFLNRLRSFRKGFADLAISTGAAVVPVFATLRPSGEIVLELCDPLRPSGGDRDQRIESLLHQYADLFAARWLSHLQWAGWKHLEHHVSLPPLGPGTSGVRG